LDRKAKRRMMSNLGGSVLIGFRGVMGIVPDAWVEAVGRGIGRLMMWGSKKHRLRALENLKLVFPEMPEMERVALVKKIFAHYGMVTTDFLTIHKRSTEQIEREATLEGTEHLEAALARGKGVIVLTGHFGNWERFSALISGRGRQIYVIARDANSVALNRMVNDLRSMRGTKVIPRGAAARPTIEALRRNEVVGILPDQNADEVYIPFFGHLAGTVLGPGVIAERTGATVLTAWCVRVGPRKYRMILEPPLEAVPSDGPKGEGLMRAFHDRLESIIREYPDQWLWFHDRWRNARNKGMLK
jgi:KDO2-lipid IV(A) lauroyltransferase